MHLPFIGCCISISSSDSDLLSAMGSHLLGFQSDCAITACTRALVRFHPRTLAKRQARSCSCSLVCSNCCPRMFLLSACVNCTSLSSFTSSSFFTFASVCSCLAVASHSACKKSQLTAAATACNSFFFPKQQSSPTLCKVCKRPVGMLRMSP